MHAAAALSEHPLATHAFGECAGRLLELGGGSPDLLALWATPPHAGALEDVVHATRRLLEPGVLVGCAAEGLLGGARQVDLAPALSMLAVWGLEEVEPLRWQRDGGVQHGLAGAAGTALMLADPFDLDLADVLEQLAVQSPELAVVGGTTSAARHRGGNRLWLDGTEFSDGAVGVRIGPADAVRPVLCQGTRPIGEAMTVTGAADRTLVALAGAPAIEALRRVVSELDPDDQVLAARSVEVALVDRPGGAEPTPDQQRVVAVRGVDRASGALVLDGPVDLGATARFQLRDGLGADHDLHASLADRDASAAAVVFTSTAHGAGSFATPDHQAAMLADLLPRAAIAGMTTVDEVGPVAGAPSVRHGAMSLLLLG